MTNRERAEQVVNEWSSLFMGKVANEATYANLINRITALLDVRLQDGTLAQVALEAADFLDPATDPHLQITHREMAERLRNAVRPTLAAEILAEAQIPNTDFKQIAEYDLAFLRKEIPELPKGQQ